jgi:hypothetical protein
MLIVRLLISQFAPVLHSISVTRLKIGKNIFKGWQGAQTSPFLNGSASCSTATARNDRLLELTDFDETFTNLKQLYDPR